ncbi:MAG: hypothetical protein J6A77_05555 [Lachnospiraceae bacterium]|nr:hypothetical protein [Lachnospiraceae bacterium]
MSEKWVAKCRKQAEIKGFCISASGGEFCEKLIKAFSPPKLRSEAAISTANSCNPPETFEEAVN